MRTPRQAWKNKKLKQEVERQIILTTSTIARQHYRGRHDDLGEAWLLTEDQMAQLRRLYGLLDGIR